ncbi:dermonecrotic toxin domain-containing protein [Pseudomonas sp. Pf153]|uniref:dermonecrotic toxin domain-containing protein n=1 Tax=Pseudomonas sp. Pf153 TaxID=1699309 RepID=UPI00069F67DD|nr:DUF6543 domain-containing protein [Pseudomonas sp. Pf153]
MDNTAEQQGKANGTGPIPFPQAQTAQAILHRLTRWQAEIDGRLNTQMTFLEILQEHLLVELRTHFYQGNIDPRFIDNLVDTVLQRMIDQQPLVVDEELNTPYRWPEGADRGFAVERQEVIVQTVEGIASGCLHHYKDYLRRHWRASGGDASLEEVIRQKLDDHIVQVDVTFQPGQLVGVDVDELREKLDVLHDSWRRSCGLVELATPEERRNLEALARLQLPGWLRALDESERKELETLQDRTAQATAMVDELLEGLASRRAFARHLAKDYVRNELDMEIEPDRIRVQLQWRTVIDQPVQAYSLSELLAAGPLRQDSVSVLLVENGAMLRNQPLSPAFITQLLAQVDVPAEYLRALASRYGREDLRDALFDWLAARLVQSAFIARCAGHLKAVHHDAVRALWENDDSVRSSSALKVSGLVLPNGLKCVDLLLFHRQDLQGDLLLYAPDKPDGQEWVELPSLWAVSVEIGAWTRTEAGREYLIQRISPSGRDEAREYFAKVVDRPASWDSTKDPRGAVSGLKACLQDNVATGLDNHLAQVALDESPPWYSALSADSRRTLSSLNQALMVHQQRFDKLLAGYEVFADFAKRIVTQAIAPYMRSKGLHDPVDPTTVLIDYNPGLADGRTQVASLLDLVIHGYDDNSGIDNPRKGVRSSVGQDLSRVRSAELASYIRRAYVGEQYVREIRARFLDAGAPEYAQRRNACRNLLLTRMDRDLRLAAGKSQINADEFWWLTRQVTLLSEPVLGSGPVYSGAVVQREGVIRFSIGGHIVMGVYVFTYFDPKGYAWLYTPDAPDGVLFRQYRDFSGKVAARLHDYVLQRTALGARTAVRRSLAALAASGVGVDTLREFNRVVDVRAEFDGYIERAVSDVEDITKSRAEVIRAQVVKGLLFASAPVCLVYPPFALLLDVAFIAVSVKEATHAHVQGDTDRALGRWLMASWGVLFAALGVGAIATLLGRTAGGLKSVLNPMALSARRLRDAASAIARETGPVNQAIRFKPKQAVGRTPENLQWVNEGIFQGTYRSPPSASQPRSRYFIRHKGRYYQVQESVHFGGLCLVDASRPGAFYKLPMRRMADGKWVHNKVGLRGGNDEVRNLGKVGDLREAFPGHVFPDVSRGALQGEAVVAKFSEAVADNYLFSLNAQTCVIASLYNPATRVGAVIHFDHNIRALIERSIKDVISRLGGSAREIRVTLAGGDWLTGADIGGRVRSIMRRQGLKPTWDHWSYSSCLGSNYGVSLDLRSGMASVFKTSRSQVERYYIPVLARAKKSSDPVSVRARGFMTRMRSEPLVANANGVVQTSQGRPATASQIQAHAFPTVVLS